MLMTLFCVTVLAGYPALRMPWDSSAHAQSTQTSPLTLAQVKGLLSISAPDATIAEELKARGSAFGIDERTLADLKTLGAGPKTLAALMALQPHGTLVVDAHQEVVQVYVDSTLVGQTDGRGVLRLQLVTGEHEITVRRQGNPGQSTVRRLVEKDRETIVDIPSEVQPVRVGGNIKPPAKIRDVRPVYPSEARPARAQGIVILDLVLNADGSVRDVKVLRSISLLDSAAVETAKQWVYAPTEINGVRVPVVLTETVQFNFENDVIQTRTSSSTPLDAQQYPMTFPVVHAHRAGRCWGTLIVSKTSLRYEQSDGGKDSFDVPLAQIANVGAWSQAQLEVELTDGRKLHFAHGVMRNSPGSGFSIAALVDLRAKEPVIAAIKGAK